MIKNSNCKLTLERRITRLENLIRANKHSTKNEGLTYDQRDEISDAVWGLLIHV